MEKIRLNTSHLVIGMGVIGLCLCLAACDDEPDHEYQKGGARVVKSAPVPEKPADAPDAPDGADLPHNAPQDPPELQKPPEITDFGQYSNNNNNNGRAAN